MTSPFRDGPLPNITVNGSGDPEQFLDVFEQLLRSALPTDLSTMSVKELKAALRDRRVSTVGASEKADLVELLRKAAA